MSTDPRTPVLTRRITLPGPRWMRLMYAPWAWWQLFTAGRGILPFGLRVLVATATMRLIISSGPTTRLSDLTPPADRQTIRYGDRQTEHSVTPLTPKDLRFIELLLDDGDSRTEERTLPRRVRARGYRDGEPISTSEARAALGRAQTGGHPLTVDELLAIGDQLQACAELVSACVCEDMSREARDLFTPEEWDALDRAYHEWNGDPDEYEPGGWTIQGPVWMRYYAAKCRALTDLRAEIKEK